MMKRAVSPPIPKRYKKQKRLSKEEFERIVELHKQGVSQKDIADRTGRGSGTVCTVLRVFRNGGTFKERVPVAFMNRRQVEAIGIKEMDFSSLPDTILFEYSREDYT